jgi:hypothetical protein
MSLNGALSKLFRTTAAVMEIKGEAVFKAIYRQILQLSDASYPTAGSDAGSQRHR